jgi:hypothetical protein
VHIIFEDRPGPTEKEREDERSSAKEKRTVVKPRISRRRGEAIQTVWIRP